MASHAPGVLVTDSAQLRELVEESAIPLDLIRAAKIYTCASASDLAKMSGLSKAKWTEAHLPALVFPHYAPGSKDPETWTIKPRVPMVLKEREAKYIRTKGLRPGPYLPPNLWDERALLDASRPKLITEGEKKALSACAIGYQCFGLAGVDNWRRTKGKRALVPILHQVARAGAEFFLVYDSDRTTNLRGVRRAEAQLAEALAAAGGTVFVVRLPNGEGGAKVGLDDYIRAQGAGAQLALRRLLSEARDAGAVASPSKEAYAPPGFARALTDLGNAERFAKDHGHSVRFCADRLEWFEWTGRVWAPSLGVADRKARETVRGIYAEAAQEEDPEMARALADWAQRSESASRLMSIPRIAQSLEALQARVSDFDADPWALVVDNGIVDLRTGELRPHARQELHTRSVAVRYEPEARSEVWETFLGQATGGNADFERFLQKAVGYSLTGDTSEQKIFMVYGPGGTGKSTFLSAVSGALGQYCETVDFEVFLAERNAAGDRAKPTIARLPGSRMVLATEVQEGARMAEGLVKTVTGGDAITARALFRPPLTFTPRFKLWLAANDAPYVRREDDALWRRILRLPFEARPRAVDAGLAGKLRTEEARQAVLAWAVRGCLLWQSEGLEVPEVIEESTALYREEVDATGDFLRFCLIFERGAKVPFSDLRKSYVTYCDSVGAPSLSDRRLARAIKDELRARGLLEPVKRGARGPNRTTMRVGGMPQAAWVGLRLRQPWDPMPPGMLEEEPVEVTPASAWLEEAWRTEEPPF